MSAHAGTAFAAIREVLDLSIIDLAERADVSAAYLEAFERGEVQPSSRWVRGIACELLGRSSA